MKKSTLTTAVSFLLAAGSYVNDAAAHTIFGGVLGAGSGTASPATDLYKVNCFAWGNSTANVDGDATGDGVQLFVSLQALGQNASVYVTRVQDSVGISTVSDNSAATAYTSGQKAGTNGDFYVAVQRTTKSNTTPSSYNLIYHCQNASGVHTGTVDDVTILTPAYFLQNQ